MASGNIEHGGFNTPTQVIDELGRVHHLGACLGRGGQGAVYEVEGGRLAAKLMSGATPSNTERLRRRLAAVRRLPLDGLPIARPMELLAAPQVGYLMPLLKDVVPIRTLLRPDRGRNATPEWYAETGGLRRRLKLLASLADTFSALHGRALAYGDPSPSNVLVSRVKAANEKGAATNAVWLIDSDNITFESSPVAASTMLFTQGYGAPELFTGRSAVSTLTDTHALAVLAYQTLVVTHPLLGDRVQEGEPDLEDEAYAGKLPWVDHPTDDTNRSSHGIKRDVVIAPRLGRVFAAAFGEGLNDPLRRPGTSALAEALNSATDFTVVCQDCGSTHYANSAHCPWCAAPATPFVLGRVYRWDPVEGVTLGAKMLHAFVVESENPYKVPSRIAGASWPEQGGIHLAVQSKGVDVWTSGQIDAWIALPDGSRRRPLHATAVTLPVGRESSSWFIHTGESSVAHRAITLTAMGHRR